MKASYALLSKLFFCAAIVFMVSASGVMATPAETASAAKASATGADGTLDDDAFIDALIESLNDASLADVGDIGTAFVDAVDARGELFESIAFEVLSMATELGATAAELASLQTSLADASADPNSGSLAQSAYNDASGAMGDATARSGGQNASAPVGAGSPAGGGAAGVPEGCSPTDYVCIAANLGITVEQARIEFGP